jgi:hypothetical protein
MQRFYENAAMGMYDGLERRMSAVVDTGNARDRHVRNLFEQARR